MKNSEILALFDDWHNALKSGDAGNVVALYDNDGILLPTVSNQVRHNHQEMHSYFVDFVARGPKCSIDESNIRTFGEIAINSGVYSFTFNDGASVQARYTFVYRWNGQRWLIIEHHSSMMPESM